MIYVSIDPNDL